MSQWEKLQTEIIENQVFYNYLIHENEELTKSLKKQKSLTEKISNDLENERNTSFSKILPIDLIQKIFPDIQILPKAFRFLVKENISIADWNKIFRCLKLIDWKNDNFKSNGITMNKFPQALSWGYKNMWEYRFSKAGRLFVERKENSLPQIVLIDPNHLYSDLSLF